MFIASLKYKVVPKLSTFGLQFMQLKQAHLTLRIPYFKKREHRSHETLEKTSCKLENFCYFIYIKIVIPSFVTQMTQRVRPLKHLFIYGVIHLPTPPKRTVLLYQHEIQIHQIIVKRREVDNQNKFQIFYCSCTEFQRIFSAC